MDNSFLKIVPYLRCTLGMKIKSLTNLADLNKRLESEEYRINSRAQMHELYALYDSIYKDHVEELKWNLSECVKMEN